MAKTKGKWCVEERGLWVLLVIPLTTRQHFLYSHVLISVLDISSILIYLIPTANLLIEHISGTEWEAQISIIHKCDLIFLFWNLDKNILFLSYILKMYIFRRWTHLVKINEIKTFGFLGDVKYTNITVMNNTEVL